MPEFRERLIVALDVSSAAAAQKIVAAVGDSAHLFKVGMQLYTAEGPQIVRDLIGSGRQVFLDLKFHDIPNTVAAAAKEAAKLGVRMFTVHAGGSAKMLHAAVEAAKAANPATLVLGVTVLTSFDDRELEMTGVLDAIPDQVHRLAALAVLSGCHGIVTSAQEAPALRKELGTHFVIVTPGVRPAGAAHGDQARVVTPAEAMKAGVNYIVVGRPITQAPDPAAAAREIVAEMRGRVHA